jgi:trk system potassium uptake protein
MYIIIVGGGGVGCELARNLSGKNQDVVIVEKNSDTVQKLSETLDVMVIEGNGANAAALEKAGIKSAEMLIAVTEVDEINIISCMLGKRYGVAITVARIRDADYTHISPVLTREQLGIDHIINPEKAVAHEISKMLHFPDAGEIEYFNQGKVMMLGLHVGKEAGITGQPLHKLPLPPGCIIVGISGTRDKFIIPGGTDVIDPGDKIYLLGSSRILKDISWLLHHPQTRVNQVTILGGGMIGLQLARRLEKSKHPFTVKLVERDPERCRLLSRELSRTLVLHGDATELSFFREEEMEQADAVIALTGDDRTNILCGVLARQFNVRKIICEVMSPQYVPVYNTLGIDSVINPRLVAASQILRLTRREDVVALSILQDEKAEVIELILPETARVARRNISQANFPRGMLIGSIVRQDEVIIPHGETVLQPGDSLVIFTLPQFSGSLERFFAAERDKEGNRSNRFIQLENA